MKAIGFTKRQKMIAATGSAGLKTITSHTPSKHTLTGAGTDMDGDKKIAFLILDGNVYSSTASTAIDTAEAFMDINADLDPSDPDYETFDCELSLATSSKGREYIAISLF